MNKEYKRYIIITFAIIIVLLLAISSVIYYADPFHHYHAALKGQKLYDSYSAYYQNVGLAKYVDYDSVITGSSMTQNFETNQFAALFGGKIIKLTFSGGCVDNYMVLFSQVFTKNRNIKNIFYGLDMPMYINDINENSDAIPKYLVDDNIFTDINYLFNKEVLYEHVPYVLKNERPIDWNKIYLWYPGFEFSEEIARKNYTRPDIQHLSSTEVKKLTTNVQQNLERLEQVISSNPNTEFYVFLPPYSILYYDFANRLGKLSAVLDGYELVLNSLVQYDNVRLSAFYYDKDIILNLDNYKDYSHYSEKINAFIADKMADGTYEINKDNVDDYLRNSRKFFEEYNYDALFK